MSKDSVQAIVDEAKKLDDLCGGNHVQRVGVWVEATKKLAALARKREEDLRYLDRLYRKALGEPG